MSADLAQVHQRPRRSWDVAPSSLIQERFYRELMAAHRLPSAPEIARRMLTAVNRDDANVQPLTDLISRDQALAARLLQLANSAFFAVRKRVTNIPHAVTLLGYERVRDVALGLSVWGALGGASQSERRYRRALWLHSTMVAAAAQKLCERTGGDGPSAFAAGLLHDIGKLVRGLRLGGSYWELLDEAAEYGQSAAIVESDTFGCHHATVGGWFLQIWQLPPELVDPVALHHEPLAPEFGFDVPAAVAVADRLVDATDARSGTAHSEVLAEVRGFAPGLLRGDEWRDLYGELVREQHAVANLFA